MFFPEIWQQCNFAIITESSSSLSASTSSPVQEIDSVYINYIWAIQTNTIQNTVKRLLIAWDYSIK